jgi:transcriptional antiterminator RfaH
MTFWAVAQTSSNRESYVAERIAESGFEIFMPQTRMRINGDSRIVALFPGYLFVRIIDRWRAVTKTAGVLGLIMSGEQPARCPEDEVEAIKSQMRNGLVRLPKPAPKPRVLPFKLGQAVRIISGSFCGFEAIFDGMSARERELVLLDMLGRKARVELAPGDGLALRELASATSLSY